MKKLLSLTLAMLLVLSCLAGVSFAADAQASWTDGSSTVEGTVAELAKQVSKVGGTLKLLKDVDMEAKGYAITSNTSFTFDLNGHNFKVNGMGISITDKASGVTVITDSVGGGTYYTEKNNITVRGGGLQIKNVAMWAEGAQAINYYDVSGAWNKENIIENATVVSSTWFCLSFNNTEANQEKSSFTVKNSTLVCNSEKGHNVLGLQTKPEGSTANIVLGEGVKLYTKGKTPVHASMKQLGEKLTQTDGTKSLSAMGKTLEGFHEWTTPATATVDLSAVIPAGGAAPAPAAPAAPAAPTTPAQTYAPNLLVEPASGSQASWTDGSSTAEGKVVDMVKQAASKGGVVKLLKDVSLSADNYAISSGTSFTLDLNGHLLKTNNFGISISNKATGITVITDSVGGGVLYSGKCNITVRGGGLHIKNVTLWADAQQSINYYVDTDAYNKANIIENSTIVSGTWYCLSFNNTETNQEKACFTVKNSTLVSAKAKGSTLLGLQTKPEGSTAQVAFGEGVKLYTNGSAAVHGSLKQLGETLTKSEGTKAVTVLDVTLEGMNEWTTPATATVDLSTVVSGPDVEQPTIPTAPAAPAEPTTPAEPSKPAEDKKDDEKKDPVEYTGPNTGAPVQEEGSANVGLVIAIAMAVVVIAAVAVIVLKKKKK